MTFVSRRLYCAIPAAIFSSFLATQDPQPFASSWPSQQRTWIGPDYWANRLQDWRVHDGRLECLQAVANKPMRTVHLLTHRLGAHAGTLSMSVRTGLIDDINSIEGAAANCATGFLLAAGGTRMTPRAATLIHHNPGPGGGWFAGIDGSGRVFIRNFVEPLRFGEEPSPGSALASDRRTAVHRGKLGDVTLQLNATPSGDTCKLHLRAISTTDGAIIGEATAEVSATEFAGNLALVSHPGGIQKTHRYWFRDWPRERRSFERWASATARFWFRDWRMQGSKLDTDLTRALGPILATQYTTHESALRLTAQFMPINTAANDLATLELLRDGAWQTVSVAKIRVPGFTATFDIKNWDAAHSHDYRVSHRLKEPDGSARTHRWSGTIAKDPVDRDTVTLAAFTGNMMARGGYEYPLPYGIDRPFDPELEGKPVRQSNTYDYQKHIYFPHTEVVANVRRQEPDLLFFSGDQVYEGNPTRAVEHPFADAHLDYLYKWYLWCWTWRDLTRDIPCITIPDDHDVYQRNIWGGGGALVRDGDLDGSFGGYFMEPRWINMIQRTQTSQLPSPHDPNPLRNGIEAYYTSVTVGGVGFAVIEDRKFKSFPTLVKAEMSRDSHITQAPYDIEKADVASATLLGPEQLQFLDEFAKDWRGQTMKAVLSQTIFANLQILNQRKDGVPQEFAIPLDRDLDSNGWPQSGRRKALQAMRKGFMVHIAGDQHLASTIHHGTDDWEDACWSLCVPSVANYYARSWNPDYPPLNQQPGMKPFTGRYEDGFRNKLTVAAVANPDRSDHPTHPEPVELHREMPGYGIVRFNKAKRQITMECWPRHAVPGTGKPYDGWPITIDQGDNYARKAVAWLPHLKVTGMIDPVIEVIDEASKEVVYTLRIAGSSFHPKVFREGLYTIRVGEPGTPQFQTRRSVPATTKNSKTIEIEFKR